MKTSHLKVISPYNQEAICEVPYDQGEALERKVKAARAAYEAWRRTPLEERMRQVKKGLERFLAAADEVARDVTLQMGKPIGEARREVQTFRERAEHMIGIAARSLAPDLLPAKEGFHLRIEHVPLGVVFNIAAWNYPLLIPVNVIVPALLAGNSVLLKHSAKTPLVGKHLESAFGELEPPRLLTGLVLTHEDTAKLIADPRIDHVAFTGSVDGGREVYREAAGSRFIDVGLELGGKDPAYVAEDADLDFAVENVVDGACYNAGQSCCAVERVYVHKQLYPQFLERSKAVLERYRLADPRKEETTMGPLASRSALDLLERQVEDARRRGAKILLGGKRLPDTAGNFFSPTLLAGVPNDAEAMQEESFGPLVPVLSVADDGEALKHMNDTRFGLTASVWTRDRERAERFARELEAGTIYQNRCDYLEPSLPWTGFRDSGKGSTLTRYGFYHLTRRKGIHFRASP
jgi:acyl-CoA reductase-like NAD-dependent aldehyde dehydrogenase